MSYHSEEEQMPKFTFTILKSFKDYLSRQVAEALMIHHSGDELLNSKNQYLARVVVEENAFKKEEENQLGRNEGTGGEDEMGRIQYWPQRDKGWKRTT